MAKHVHERQSLHASEVKCEHKRLRSAKEIESTAACKKQKGKVHACKRGKAQMRERQSIQEGKCVRDRQCAHKKDNMHKGETCKRGKVCAKRGSTKVEGSTHKRQSVQGAK